MLILASAVALLFAGPQQASPPQDTTTPAQAAAPVADATTTQADTEEAAEPRMVCRNETLVGTRFPTRVCMRQEERDARTRDSRALAHRMDVQNSNRDRIYAPTAGSPQ